jgi:hypothetical protein
MVLLAKVGAPPFTVREQAGAMFCSVAGMVMVRSPDVVSGRFNPVSVNVQLEAPMEYH